jgi:hypothetical protein
MSQEGAKRLAQKAFASIGAYTGSILGKQLNNNDNNKKKVCVCTAQGAVAPGNHLANLCGV